MASVSGLDSYFVNIINDLMYYERQPLYQMQNRRDTFQKQTSAYTALDSRLSDLQSSVRALISSDGFYSLKIGRSASVSDAPADKTVFSATTSSSAVPGQYDIAVTKLAKAQRVALQPRAVLTRPWANRVSFGWAAAEPPISA